MENCKKWVAQEIEKIAAIGKGPQGITRLAYTEQDRIAGNYVKQLMQEAGLAVRVDQAGNIIGRREGRDPLAPAVITGSHLDTVPESGKYDGVVGVIAGLAALERLKNVELKHPVEVIAFAGEESSRFGFANIGSKAMAGFTNLHAWKKAKDFDGISLPQALEICKLDIQRFAAAKRSGGEMKAFVELHIEQGPVLCKSNSVIGIVEKIAAPTRFKITVEGISAHSGTTSMEERRDALVSAAMIILAIEEIALDQSENGTVATVGAMKVHPGAMNVIPGKVEMWVDVRGLKHESVIECLQEVKDAVSTIAEGQETSVSIEMIVSEKPVSMDMGIVSLIENICREKHIKYEKIDSKAGHDAMSMGRLIPAGMIFIPSQNGISHNPDEYTDMENIMAGIEVLTETLHQLAK
jgi:N-carbamoyl-L-amino-acid hydrolase